MQQSFILRNCLELTVASLILKKITKKDLNYLSNNLREQKKILVNYNKNKNIKYISLDNQFHKHLFKIADLEPFWNIILEHNFDFDRLRHISATSKKRSIESTNEHIAIYDAIRKNNISLLKKKIKNHFNYSKKYYNNIIKLNKDFIE